MFLPFLLKKIILPFLLLLSFYQIYMTIDSIWQTSVKKDALSQQILGLKDQKKALEDKFLVINSDEFIEKEARTKLNMKKEGEEIYLVPSTKAPEAEVVEYVETEGKLQNKQPNFSKWVELLF
jgi:cell division protein FtsB